MCMKGCALKVVSWLNSVKARRVAASQRDVRGSNNGTAEAIKGGVRVAWDVLFVLGSGLGPLASPSPRDMAEMARRRRMKAKYRLDHQFPHWQPLPLATQP